MRKDKSSLFNWSTAGMLAEERLSEFDRLLKQSLISVTTTIDDHSRFWCHLSTLKAGQFSITDINGSAKRSQRDRKNILRSASDEYHLVYAGATWRFINRYGQEITVPAGSVILLDTRKEYISLLPEGFLNRTLALPAEWLNTWVANPEKMIEQNLSELSGWGKVLAAYLEQISPPYLSTIDFQPPMILDQIGMLLSLLYHDLVSEDALSRKFSRDRNYQKIVESLHQRHMNLVLTATDIAREVGISTRTLHRVMANQGTSFGQALINYRANSALRMLNTEEFDELSIADIAKRAGFVDVSHFNRVCKTYFGESPGKIRKKRP